MKEYSGQKICENIVKYSELGNKKFLEIGCGTGRISAFEYYDMPFDSDIALKISDLLVKN